MEMKNTLAYIARVLSFEIYAIIPNNFIFNDHGRLWHSIHHLDIQAVRENCLII